MKLTTLQWNIGGGKIRAINSGSTVSESYNRDGVEYITSLLKDINPDIITLQEVHCDKDVDQVSNIASKLGLGYYVSDFYADSHIEKGQRLGQAIISKYPISSHTFELFINPQYKNIWEDGSIAVSHDKGITSVEVEVDSKKARIITTHLIPFRRFDVDPISTEAEVVMEDIQNKLHNMSNIVLIQGDFNLDYVSLRTILPNLFINDMGEVLQTVPTTPKGRKYDHVLFRGLKMKKTYTNDTALTDHFPVITVFEV